MLLLIVSLADLDIFDAANREVRSACSWKDKDRGKKTKQNGANFSHNLPGQKVVTEHGAKVERERGN